MTLVNSSFSTQLPGLQLGLDSTSLGTFKSCPRKYQLSLVNGWSARGESPHLTFGIHLHKARERYDHARAKALPHEDALDSVLSAALADTWNVELGRPWVSDHPTKDRSSLIRTIVWYLDQFGENDPIETLTLANGKPAVELSFRFDSGYRAKSTGEAMLLCGHLDRIGKFNDDYYVVDIKTTGSQLGQQFFSSFTPDNQFSLYSLAANVGFAFPVKGVILDGIQIGATFSRFARAPVPRPQGVIEDWYEDLGQICEQMESFALAKRWPQNDKACGMYGGCEFREVCGRSPASREQWLKLNYVKRIWDPLVARGE